MRAEKEREIDRQPGIENEFRQKDERIAKKKRNEKEKLAIYAK